MLYNRVLKITNIDPVAFYNHENNNNFRNLRLDQSFALYNTVMFSFFFQRDLGREGVALWKWTQLKMMPKGWLAIILRLLYYRHHNSKMVRITLFLKWNEKLLLEKVDHVTIYCEKTFTFIKCWISLFCNLE